jgi:hypothetical protein
VSIFKLILIAMATVVVGALFAPSATAGIYSMWQCGAGKHAPDWSVYGGQQAGYFNSECATHGRFGLESGPLTHGTSVGMTLDVPASRPNVSIVEFDGSMDTAQEINEVAVVRWWATAGGTEVNLLNQEMKPYNADILKLIAPAGTRSTRIDVYCTTANSGADCDFSRYVPVVGITGLMTVLTEDAKPDGALIDGSLLDAGPRSATQSLIYSATDQDSGVKKVTVKLGSDTIASDDYSDTCTYMNWNACPLSQTRAFAVNTANYDDGRYPLTMEVTDAADNTATIDTGRTVAIKNGRGPGEPNGSKPCSPCALFVGVGTKRLGQAVKVGHKDMVPISGRLLTPEGQPVSGAKLDVLNEAGPEGTATTGADGSFVFVDQPGPSRHVTFAYRAHENDPGYAATGNVFIRVKDAVRIRATPRRVRRGSKVKLEGRLTGVPGAASQGVLVTLQGKAVRDRRWRTFASTRADSTGYFSTFYRFARASAGQRFVMRARATSQTGFPFPTDYSKSVSVRVR